MKQVVQATGGGRVVLVEAPVPSPGPTELLVRTEATVISPGTERAVTNLAQSSMLAKARARPDLVRQVVERARREGIASTAAAVRARLGDDIPLGYSGAGNIVEIGDLVRGFRVGQRVATAGAGYANHAEFQVVPQTLASPIPDGVPAQHAAFATVASIALHGFRQADVAVGAKVLVIGLGLIGQLTCRLAQAGGCDVLGVDLDPVAVDRAVEHGATGLLEKGSATTRAIQAWSRGRGADAVIITAGARNDSSIIQSVPERCRDRATVVAVGDVGLDLDRNAFYHRELQLRLARSYGPGRYDPTYEEWGVDYPVGHVRWTEGRNLEAVLDLMALDRLAVDDLIGHRFDINDALGAYDELDRKSPGMFGIVMTYPNSPAPTVLPQPRRQPRAATGRIGVGICGAGSFVRSSILPTLRAAGLGEIVHISSESGTTAARLAERETISSSSSGVDGLLADERVELVVVATSHRSHANLVVAALKAARHVYVEKPVAISEEDFEQVLAAYASAEQQMHIGFNRRWAPMICEARQRLEGSGPRNLHYRVNAGPLPEGHWYADRREGGRLLGEVCHFVDTANSLMETAPVSVSCIGPNTDANDSYGLLIGYADGSIATIGYNADGSRSTAKEWCEIQGGGHTLVIDDYRSMSIDGKQVKVARGKGHAESLVAFHHSLRAGRPHDVSPLFQSSWVTLCAMRSIVSGTMITTDRTFD